jgi:hypothetical protein
MLPASKSHLLQFSFVVITCCLQVFTTNENRNRCNSTQQTQATLHAPEAPRLPLSLLAAKTPTAMFFGRTFTPRPALPAPYCNAGLQPNCEQAMCRLYLDRFQHTKVLFTHGVNCPCASAQQHLVDLDGPTMAVLKGQLGEVGGCKKVPSDQVNWQQRLLVF